MEQSPTAGQQREVSTEHLILHMICLIIQPVREKCECGYRHQSIIEEDFSTVHDALAFLGKYTHLCIVMYRFNLFINEIWNITDVKNT